MSEVTMTPYNKPQTCLQKCTGWPQCACGAWAGYAQVQPPPKGCICPPTAEQTCQRWDCGRKSVPVSVTGTITTTVYK
jgi:hypothetical protein